MKIEYCHSTATGSRRINLTAIDLPIATLQQYYHEPQVRDACRTGCMNFNKKWCCPPVAKNFEMLAEGYSYAIIICLHINLTDFECIKSKYQRIRAANSVLKSQSNRISRKIELECGGLALLNGSCCLCKPCAKKLDLLCRKPEQMRYSLEATGINVCNLLEETIGFQLQWYSREFMPQYTAVASGILHNLKHLYDRNSLYSLVKMQT